MLFEFCPGGHLLNLLDKAEAPARHDMTHQDACHWYSMVFNVWSRWCSFRYDQQVKALWKA